jgi:hypothetical protein
VVVGACPVSTVVIISLREEMMLVGKWAKLMSYLSTGFVMFFHRKILSAW